MTKCVDCGYDGDSRVYFKRSEKIYCDKCYKKRVKPVYPVITRSELTCPFCGKKYEFDGVPDIEECSCGAKVDYRFDDVMRFIRWDDDDR